MLENSLPDSEMVLSCSPRFLVDLTTLRRKDFNIPCRVEWDWSVKGRETKG